MFLFLEVFVDMAFVKSGFFNFKIANLIADGRILKKARSAAFAIIKEDPALQKSNYMEMKHHFQKSYQYLLKNMNIT